MTIRSDRSAAETATTTTSTAAPSSQQLSSSFVWPSGNSYDKHPNRYKNNNSNNNISNKHAVANNFPQPKALFAKNDKEKEKTMGALFPPSFTTSPTCHENDDEVSAATSVTARVLREAAKHCIKGQELMSSSLSASGRSEKTSPLHASIKEYRAALYILEKTIGTGFADRRECRSLLVMSQVFYWIGIAFKELASSCSSSSSRRNHKYTMGRPSNNTIDANRETHERNAIQSLLLCLRLRYHLLDRGEEEEKEQESADDDDVLLTRFVSPVMDIQLVLTNLWESSPSPFCNMTVRESARKLQRLRIATWNEDKGDDFMFAIARENLANNNSNKSSNSSNLDKALAHYRKALETFSDENFKNDIMRLKIASCYRQSGLRKLNNNDEKQADKKGTAKDFDTAVFWYRSALKSFCGTVRFAPMTSTATATETTRKPLTSTQPQSPTPSVSSIDMSSTDSLEDEEQQHSNSNNEPILTKHPTYERIIMRIEEILSWKQQQKQKLTNNKTTIERETTMRHYLRSTMKESISHQAHAESLLSPTAVWRRSNKKSMYLSFEGGIKLDDEAASTMSSMSVLANALIMLRASLRIEEAVWGDHHPIVWNLRETIESTDEEYLDAEEQHATAAFATQRVETTDKKTKEYREFHKHVEDLVEENKRLKTALDDSGDVSRQSRYQQRSGEPSNYKGVVSALATASVPISPLNSDEAIKPVEYINIIPSQTIHDGSLKLPFETRGDTMQQPEVSSKSGERFESMVHVMNRCQSLETELRDANEKILRLSPKAQSRKQQQEQEHNRHLEKRCRELEEELEESSKLREDLSAQVRSLEAKLEDQVHIHSVETQNTKDQNALQVNRLARINKELKASKDRGNSLAGVRQKLEDNYHEVVEKSKQAESDLQTSKSRCTELEHRQNQIQEANTRIETENKLLSGRYTQAEASLELSKKRCIELEKRNEELGKKDENDALRNHSGETETKLIIYQERLEKSAPEERLPETNASQNQKKIEEENNRLVDLCSELEKDVLFMKDENEKLIARVEAELLISKDQCTKLESQLGELKEADWNEKTLSTTRVAQVEKDIEQLSKEGDEIKAKLEKEREGLNEKLESAQNSSSVMAQEHELLVIGLKNDTEAAVESKKEREDRISELEKELKEANEKTRIANVVLAATLYLEKDPEVLTNESRVDATKSDETQEEYRGDDSILENNVDDSERDNTVEVENLTIRVAELARELDNAEERGEIETERLEKELVEQLGKEKNLVKELEMIVEKGKQEQERMEKSLKEMVTKEQSEETLSSRVAELEEEKRVTAQELKEVIEAKEKETNRTQIVRARVLEIERNQFSSRVAELEEEKKVAVEELKAVIETKEKETNQTEILRAHVSELEKDVKSDVTEQNQLRETISKLETQVKEMATEKEKKSSELQSIESMQEENNKDHGLVIARCTELENELEDAKKTENRQQELVQQIAGLEDKLESSTKKNAEISLEMKLYEAKLKTGEDLLDQTKEEHRDLLEKFSRLENETQESQLDSDKNVVDTEQRIETLTNSIDELRNEKDAITMELFDLKGNLKKFIESNVELSSQIESLTTSSQAEKEDKARMENLVAQLQQELKSVVERNQEERNNLKNCSIELEKEVGLGKDENQREQTILMKRIVNLKGELKDALVYNDNLSSTLDSYVEERSENEELQKRYISLEKEIESLEDRKATEQQVVNEDIIRLKKQQELEFEKNTDEKAALARQISALEKEMATAEELHKSFASERESHDDKAKELQLALESTTTENESFVQQISALQNELASITVGNKIIVSENRSSEKEAKELQLKLEQNREEHDALLEQLATLEIDLESSISKNKELSSKTESFEDERKNLESTAKEAVERQEFIDRIAAVQKDFESISAENDTLLFKIASLNEAKKENEHLSNLISSLEDQLELSVEDNARLSESIESLKNSEVDHQRHGPLIAKLKKELQSSQETNCQLSVEIESLRAQKEDSARLKNHISDIESELESLQATNQTLSTNIEFFEVKEEENRRLKDQLSELDSSEATNRNLTVLVDSFREKEEEHQRTANRLSELENDLNSLEATNRSLATKNKYFEEQEEELIHRISDLEIELESSRMTNQTLIADAESLKGQESEHIDRIDDLVTQFKSSQVTNLGLAADVESLRGKQTERINRILDLEAELETSQARNQSLVAEIESLKAQQEERHYSMNQVSDLEKELYNMKVMNKSLTADMESLESQKQECDRMKNQVSTLKEDIEKANNNLMSQQECIEAKEEEIAGFASQISKLQCDLDLATQENGRLAEDSKSFDSSYDSINDNLNRAKEDNKALQARCKIYDTELQGFRNEIDRVKAKAEEDKKSLIKKNDVDQKEKEDIATRCLELENIVKESTEENKELTSLLRQKSSQIEALNQTIDEVEALNQKSLEYDDMVNQCSEVEKELLKTIEFNEELTDEMKSLKEDIKTLNSSIFEAEIDLKEQVKELQNSQKSNKGLTKRCSALEKELENVKDKIAYPDSVEDGHEWTRIQLRELENRMEDVKKENEELEDRMEDVMEENELVFSRLEEYKNKLEHEKNLKEMKNDENLVNQCKEVEKELFKIVEMNDELKGQVVALKKQIEDWKAYAENTENELEEESEALQDAEKKNADLLTAMTILNRENEKITSQTAQSKDYLAQMMETQTKEHKLPTDQCSKLEINLEKAKKERDMAKNNVESLTAAKQNLQNLLEEAVQDIHELEESTDKLNAVILAKNQMKRLLDKAELGRDEMNEKYGRCKRELHLAKEHLHKANAEKDELNRRLDIEKHVSLAYKSEDKNEFDELYRKAREEMNNTKMMLEESRACVTDLEENVEILEHQLHAALTFKSQQSKAKTNRKFFGWRGGNINENQGSAPAVVSNDGLADDHEEVMGDGNKEEQK